MSWSGQREKILFFGVLNSEQLNQNMMKENVYSKSALTKKDLKYAFSTA